MDKVPEENLENESLNQLPPISKNEQELQEIALDLDDKKEYLIQENEKREEHSLAEINDIHYKLENSSNNDNEFMKQSESEIRASDLNNKPPPFEDFPPFIAQKTENNEILAENENFETTKSPPKKPNMKKALAKKPKPVVQEIQNPDSSLPPSVPIIDELPIGKSSNFQISEYPPDYDPSQPPLDSEKLPLGDRARSKIWKTRIEAFEELAKLFEDKEKAEPTLEEFPIKEIAKFLNDSNPNALDKALICLKMALSVGGNGGLEGVSEEVCKVIFEKCMTSTKPLTKKLAGEILFLLFEKLENAKVFNTHLIGLLSNKNPKVATLSLTFQVELIQNYGPRPFEYMKLNLSEAEKLAANSTIAAIKNESINLFKEGYRWMGAEMVRMYISKLKKSQIEELEKFFEENPWKEAPQPIRECKENRVKEGEKEKKGDENDPFELAEPVDIWAKFGENWTSKVLALEKWSEKKESLEAFISANLRIPRFTQNPSSISAIHQMIKRLLTDNNVQVSISTVKVVSILFKSLRRGFFSNAKALFPFLLDKLKEKKGVLLDESLKALDLILFCLNLDEMLDIIKENLEGKNSILKVNLLIWLEKAFYKQESMNVNVLKGLLPCLKKLVEDGAIEVRNQTSNFLVKLVEKESKLLTLFSDLPVAKLEKLKENVQKTKENKDSKEGKENKDKPAEKKEEKKPAEKEKIEEKPIQKNKKLEEKKMEEKRKLISEEKKNDEETKKNIEPKKKAYIFFEQPDIHLISDDDSLLLLISNELPEDLIKKLGHNDWREKLNAIQEIFNDFSSVIYNHMEPFLTILRTKWKNWKEPNVNLLKEFFILFIKAYENNAIIEQSAFYVVISLLIEKITDPKLSEYISQIIDIMIVKIPTENLIALLSRSMPGKGTNVKLLNEFLLKIIDIVKQAKVLPLFSKDFINVFQQCTHSINPTLKTTVHLFVKTLIDFFGITSIDIFELPDNIMKSFDGESKVSEKTTKTEKTDKSDKIEKSEKRNQDSSAKTKEKDIKQQTIPKSGAKSDLPPKSEKSSKRAPNTIPQINTTKISFQAEASNILKNLKDKDWSIRKKGLEDLDTILKNEGVSKLVSQPPILNELFAILKSRLTDPNKPLARLFVVFLGEFVSKLEKEIVKPHQKQILMSLFTNLSDRNHSVRSEIMEAANKVAEKIGFDMIGALITQYFLNNDSPEMKSELLLWLSNNTDALEPKSLVTPLLNCLLDKNKEVRANAETLLSKAIEKLGFNIFQNGMKDLKPALRAQLENIFNKFEMMDSKFSYGSNRSFNLEDKSPHFQMSNEKSRGSTEKVNVSATFNNTFNAGNNITSKGNLNGKMTLLPKEKSPKKMAELSAEFEQLYIGEDDIILKKRNERIENIRGLESYLLFSDMKQIMNENIVLFFLHSPISDCLRKIDDLLRWIDLTEIKHYVNMANSSDLFIEYLIFKGIEASDSSENLLSHDIKLLMEIISIVKKSCRQLSNRETTLLLDFIKLLFEKELDEQPFLQKNIQDLIDSVILNSESLAISIRKFINYVLELDFTNIRFRFKLLRFTIDYLLRKELTPPKYIFNIPEIFTIRRLSNTLAILFNEEMLREAGFSEFQINFIGAKNGESKANQQIDNWINESKENLRRSVSTKVEESEEWILKNPVLNQSVSSELFLADLKLLQDGSIPQRIDALMFLNDLATSGNSDHIRLFFEFADKVLETFLFVFRVAFCVEEKNEEGSISIQFLQYFLNMLQKFVSSGLFFKHVENLILLQEFLEEVLIKMLVEDTNIKQGGSNRLMILRLMNLVMLRCLEFGKITNILTVLLSLLQKYRRLKARCYLPIFGLLCKSLLKIVSYLNKNPDLEAIDFLPTLKRLNEYLNEFYKISENNENLNNKNYNNNIYNDSLSNTKTEKSFNHYYDEQNREDIGVKCLKGFTYLLVKALGGRVRKFMDELKKVESNVYVLEKWVTMILPQSKVVEKGEREMLPEIINKLIGKEEEFDSNLQKAANILTNNPDLKLDNYLEKCDDLTKSFLTASLSKLIFINQHPFIAEENKIYRRGVNFHDNQPPIKIAPNLNFLIEQYKKMINGMNEPEISS